jgi:hypothetical protein
MILAGARSCAPMNRRCSPSTTSSGGENSGSDGVMNKAKGAALNSKPSSAAGSLHDVSLSSRSSIRPGSSDDVSPLPQSPLDTSLLLQKPSKRRNPPLTWTSEELSLVSQMRQGMMNTSRRKRSKKPKDAPKRPLR